MPKSVLDLFEQKEVLNYLKDRKYPAMMGEELFPEVKRQSLEFEMLTNGSSTPVIASVHGYDTESEIGQREAEKKAIELALIKRKMQLKEKEIIALESPRNEAERTYLMKNVYADFDALVESIKARVEKMRMEVVATGKITLDENNLNASIDYGVPTSQKVANVDWDSETSNPINDMLAWKNQLDNAPGRSITSTKILAKILSNKNVVNALFGKDSTRIASVGELNVYLENLGLPKIYTNDSKYRKMSANGTYTKMRYFPEDAFVMIPGETLGETIYGPTAEEIRLQRDPSIDIKLIGKIFACMYEDGLDPVSTWEKAVASAIPALKCADDLFQAQIILNPTVKELDITVVAGSSATKTKVTEVDGFGSGTLKYKTASAITSPDYLAFATGYSDLNLDTDITVTAGNKIIVVEVDKYNRVIAKSDIETVVVGQ